jgi:hypothetical protein
MRYLCGTISYEIHYLGHPAVLEGYSDANWISYVDDIKATSGYVFTFGGDAVSWRSCRQTILTRSTIGSRTNFFRHSHCRVRMAV